jgi:hypothetical protein
VKLFLKSFNILNQLLYISFSSSLLSFVISDKTFLSISFLNQYSLQIILILYTGGFSHNSISTIPQFSFSTHSTISFVDSFFQFSIASISGKIFAKSGSTAIIDFLNSLYS